jgi:chromosome partitioning protein
MQKIVIAQSKGGVGKTTTAVSLAHGLALRGNQVLLIDTDVQGHCARALGVENIDGLYKLVENGENTLIEARERLFLLSSGENTISLKRLISRRDMAPERVLSEVLPTGGYDYVIIDTAPSWDELVINALVYAGRILAPISLEALTIAGFVDFIKRLENVGKYYQVRLSWILPTFYDRRVKKSEEIHRDLEQHFGDLLLPVIRYNVRLSECVRTGKTIFEYDPNCYGAADYAAIVKVLDNGKA